jgi:hypothetical protein
MFSALPLRADIAQQSRHVRFEPNPDIATASLDHLVGTSKKRTGIALAKKATIFRINL